MVKLKHILIGLVVLGLVIAGLAIAMQARYPDERKADCRRELLTKDGPLGRKGETVTVCP